MTTPTGLTKAERVRLGRRAQLLAATSVTYNVVEAVVAIAAGAAAGSVALVGFGLDSIVELSSGLIIVWQFRHQMPEIRERQALRLIAVSFFALAGYIAFESVRGLLSHEQAGPSPVGIGLAVASLIVMPLLSWAQRRTGRALRSGSVTADAKQTLLCTYLSAVLLIGLALNATVGWSWADPVAGLVIAAVAVKEGRGAWLGDACCDDPRAVEASDCLGTCCRTPVPARGWIAEPVSGRAGDTDRVTRMLQDDAAGPPPAPVGMVLRSRSPEHHR